MLEIAEHTAGEHFILDFCFSNQTVVLNVLLIILQTKPANLETGIPADWMVIRNICVVYCFHLASTYTFTFSFENIVCNSLFVLLLGHNFAVCDSMQELVTEFQVSKNSPICIFFWISLSTQWSPFLWIILYRDWILGLKVSRNSRKWWRKLKLLFGMGKAEFCLFNQDNLERKRTSTFTDVI